MPKSYNTVSPRAKSCDVPRALMSIAPNLCCDETKNQGTYTRVTQPSLKREDMPTERLQEKRVEERGGGRERERAHARRRERERARARTQERESVRKRFGSSFYMFFPPPGPALCKLGLTRSAVLPEVLTPVLRPSFDLPLFYFRGLFSSSSFSHLHFGLLFSILSTSQ